MALSKARGFPGAPLETPGTAVLRLIFFAVGLLFANQVTCIDGALR